MKSVLVRILCSALAAVPAACQSWDDPELGILAVHDPPAGDSSNSATPYLFFAMGPTGSGKSSQEVQLKNLFNLRGEELVKDPPRMLLVDDLIEGDAEYRANIYNYLVQQLGDSPTKEQIAEWAANAGKDVYAFFDDQYWGCRNNWGCDRSGKGGCAKRFQENLESAYKEGHNVIYESTGKSNPAGKIAVADRLSGKEYKVVVGINTLDFCDLKHRNERRVVSSIAHFLADPHNPAIGAPRLPDLSILDKRVQAILKATSGMVDCVGQPVSKKCPARIDELYVFDNEHWGFMPNVKVKAPDVQNTASAQSLAELRSSAKSMLEFMHPHECESMGHALVV